MELTRRSLFATLAGSPLAAAAVGREALAESASKEPPDTGSLTRELAWGCTRDNPLLSLLLLYGRREPTAEVEFEHLRGQVNYAQLFRTWAHGRFPAVAKRRALREHALRLESALLFGRVGIGYCGPMAFRTTAGFLDVVRTNRLAVHPGALKRASDATVLEVLATFERLAFSGSYAPNSARLLVASQRFTEALQDFGRWRDPTATPLRLPELVTSTGARWLLLTAPRFGRSLGPGWPVIHAISTDFFDLAYRPFAGRGRSGYMDSFPCLHNEFEVVSEAGFAFGDELKHAVLVEGDCCEAIG